MSDKPPFDTVRAAFYLVAGVIAVQGIVTLAGVAFCWMQADASRCSDLRGMLNELMMSALAAALAFAGGFTKRDK